MERETLVTISHYDLKMDHTHSYLCESDLNPYNEGNDKKLETLSTEFISNLLDLTGRLVLDRNANPEDDFFEVSIDKTRGKVYVTINDDWEDELIYPETHSISIERLINAVNKNSNAKKVMQYESPYEYVKNEIISEMNRYCYEKYQNVNIGRRSYFDKYSISKDLLFKFDMYPKLSTIYTYNLLANDMNNIKILEDKVINTILSRGFIKYEGSRLNYIDMSEYKFKEQGKEFFETTISGIEKSILPALENIILPSDIGTIKFEKISGLNCSPTKDIDEEEDYYIPSKRKVMQLREACIDYDMYKSKEPKFIDIDGDRVCILANENTIKYKITITPNLYAPIKEYVLDIRYKFMNCDRLNFIRDVEGSTVKKDEVINLFPINILQMKVFDMDEIKKDESLQYDYDENEGSRYR